MTVEPLRLTIPLRPGEAALAYLSRLAARNGIPCAKHFCADWELDFRLLEEGCPGETGRLAALADVSAGDLVAACVRKDGKGYRIRSERMVASSLRRNRFHVCPACLEADIRETTLSPPAAAYGRLAWQIGAVWTCITHGIPLVDLGAGSGTTANDFTAVVRPNLTRLDELIATSHRRPPSELELYLLRRLDGRPCGVPFLDGLDLHVAIRFCEVIGALAVHGRGVHLNRIDDAEAHLAGAVGIGIASRGERAVQDLLTKLRRDYPFGHRVRAGPRPPFAEFQAWLAGHSRDPAYEPVKALLERHLAAPTPVDIEDKPYRYPGARLEAAFAVLANERPRILTHHSHQGTLGDLAMSHVSTASSASPSMRKVSLAKSARLLGCDVPTLLTLVAHGIVVPVRNEGESGWRHAVLERDLDRLRGRMMKRVSPVADPSEGMVDLAEAATRLLRTPVEILRLLLGECLAWVGRRVGGHGVNSLLFRLEELRPLVAAQELRGPTLPEAAAILGMDDGHVGALIDQGALTIEKGVYALAGVPTDVVPAASFDGFVATNIDLRFLTRRIGSKPRDTVSTLFMGGVQPSYAASDFTYYDRVEIAAALPDLRIKPALPWTSGLVKPHI